MIPRAFSRRGVLGLIGGVVAGARGAAGAVAAALPSGAVSLAQIHQSSGADAPVVSTPLWALFQTRQDRHRDRHAFRVGGCDPDIAGMVSWSPAHRRAAQTRRDDRERSILERLLEQAQR